MSDHLGSKECAPFPCTPAYACALHAVTSAELIANGSPEPPGGWAAYDARVVKARNELLDPKQIDGRNVVDCEENCGAFEEPVTLEEYKKALEHCRTHSCLGGCSHGC